MGVGLGEGRRGQDKFLKEWFSKERPIPGETETLTVTPFVGFFTFFPTSTQESKPIICASACWQNKQYKTGVQCVVLFAVAFTLEHMSSH